MIEKKSLAAFWGIVLAVSLTAAAVSAVLTAGYCKNAQFRTLSVICGEIIKRRPDAEATVLSVLKDCEKLEAGGNAEGGNGRKAAETLGAYGYRAADLMGSGQRRLFYFAAAGFLTGVFLFGLFFGLWSRCQTGRVRALAGYLADVGAGAPGILTGRGRDGRFGCGEDEFSRLRDEICKTVTALRQTRESAVEAKKRFADNLYNIAHQLKTPVTSISLAAQMMRETENGMRPADARSAEMRPAEKGMRPADAGATGMRPAEPERMSWEEAWPEETRISGESPAGARTSGMRPADAGATGMRPADTRQYLGQIEKQIARLTYLEEALLLLARVDSGTLALEKRDTDVFTVLTLAADNLREVMEEKDISVQIPEQAPVAIKADMEWTMEAVMNLFKNSMEHSPEGGVIHCSYEQNPIYTEIRIRDEGQGFDPEDIPHLFERFYRGKQAKAGGIGIGLALAREIVELQNGTLRAGNRPAGGAEFEIRFYCH